MQSAELWLFSMSKIKNKKIICFDIDNTICHTKKNFYKTSKPNPKAINAVNDLFLKGYYIKLFTSRFMGRNQDNPQKLKKKDLSLHKNNLKNGMLIIMN